MPEFLSTAATELLQKLKNSPRYTGPVERPAHDGACKPDCEICGGVGLVRYQVPEHHRLFGRLEPCPNLPAENRTGKWRFGLTVEEQQSLTWDRIEPFDAKVTMNGVTKRKTAKEIAVIIRHVVDRGYGWVWLYSGHGTAKSLYLKIAVAEALRKQQDAEYAEMVDILDHIRASYDEERRANNELIDRIEWWSTIPLLAIDEFEKYPKSSSDWTQSRVFQIMNRRWRDAVGQRTVTLIASNERPEQIDSAISSRAHDGRFVYLEIDAPDARPSMKLDDLF